MSTFTFVEGARVKVRPHCDAFMQGDVYGTVQRTTIRAGIERVHVLMDRSNRVRRFRSDDLDQI